MMAEPFLSRCEGARHVPRRRSGGQRSEAMAETTTNGVRVPESIRADLLFRRFDVVAALVVIVWAS
jgi:hypothetical protein